MRLTFILDRLNLGGAERHCLSLSRAMAARGHAVQIIVLFRGGSPRFPVDDFPTPPVLLNAKGIATPLLHWRLYAALRAFAPDRVMAVNQTALVAATLARTVGAPMGALWCRFSTTVITSRSGRMKLPLFKLCAARANGLIFVSQRQHDYWQKRGLKARQVVMIHNGIAVERFAPPSPAVRGLMRQRFGLAQNMTSFTLVGRLAPEKNHIGLISALAALRETHPDKAALMRFICIGEGPLQGALSDHVVALGLADQVIFTGGIRDIVPLLAQADCGILVSSAVETFPHAALEIMACGLPMIMTDTGGTGEILRDRMEGDLIPVGDSAGLQRALLAMTDPARRTAMGKAARQRVLAHFTDDQMFDHYEHTLTTDTPATPQPRGRTWGKAASWLS